MSFLGLANELVIQIVEYFDSEADINAVVLINCRCYNLFNTYLYKHNIERNEGRALLWAAQNGQPTTARRLLDLGADIQVKTPSDYNYTLDGAQWNIPVNALYITCLHGQPNMTKPLLEAGINDSQYAKDRESMTLYYAIMKGHDDVALVLLEHFTNIHGKLLWAACESTPLHLACYLGLPKIVKFLLNKGADVHGADSMGLTALHHALLSACESCQGYPWQKMKDKIAFKSKGADSELEVVILLLEAGVDIEKKQVHGLKRWHTHTCRQLAMKHPDKRIRAFFEKTRGLDSSLLSANRVVGWWRKRFEGPSFWPPS